MYLSKVQLKPNLSTNELAKVIPHNAYAEHKIVWKWFSSDEKTQRDFLFRREQNQFIPMFYTLSAHKPIDTDNIWHIQSKPFQPKLEAGQQLAFILRANPVVTRKPATASNPKTRKRDDVVMYAKKAAQHAGVEGEESLSQADLVQQAGYEWLKQRSESNGFRLFTVNAGSYFQHRLYKQRTNEPIRFSTIDYEGVLEVTEPEAFLKMLYKGLGRSKSFGCGLMLVRRV